MKLNKITYENLKPRQQENYNFHKIAAVLAEYGFTSIRLSDDWQGADFLAQHIDGETFLKVQLKGRLTFDKKYIGKSLHVGFSYNSKWFLYDHDELLKEVLESSNIGNTNSWMIDGLYSYNHLSLKLLKQIEPYEL